MEKINIACIGCGRIATGYGKDQPGHLSSLINIPETSIRALVDMNGKVAKEACRRYGGEWWSTNSDEVFNDPKTDAVLICTHNNSHAELLIKAIKAGKHAFVEKPLAMNIEQCKKIVDVVRTNKTNIKIMVGFRFRYASGVMAAKELIKNPEVIFGQMMDARWKNNFWATDPEKGGGNVLSQGVHMLDLVCCLANSEPDSVFAYGENFTHKGLLNVDNVSVNIRFRNGSIGNLLIGDDGYNPYPSKFFLEIFKKGKYSAVIYDRLKRIELWGVKKPLSFIPSENFGIIMSKFIESISKDEAPEISLSDGIRSVVLVHHIYKSIEEGKPIEMKCFTSHGTQESNARQRNKSIHNYQDMLRLR